MNRIQLAVASSRNLQKKASLDYACETNFKSTIDPAEKEQKDYDVNEGKDKCVGVKEQKE